MSNKIEVVVSITLLNDSKEIFKCTSTALSDKTNLKILEEVNKYYYQKEYDYE